MTNFRRRVHFILRQDFVRVARYGASIRLLMMPSVPRKLDQALDFIHGSDDPMIVLAER